MDKGSSEASCGAVQIRPRELRHIGAALCLHAKATDVVSMKHVWDAGVSNFDLEEFSKLWKVAGTGPAVVQRNSDPLNPDTLVQHYACVTGMQYRAFTLMLWFDDKAQKASWHSLQVSATLT